MKLGKGSSDRSGEGRPRPEDHQLRQGYTVLQDALDHARERKHSVRMMMVAVYDGAADRL